VVDPDDERPRVDDPKSDPLQVHELTDAASIELGARLTARIDRQRRLNDYVIRNNRIWRTLTHTERVALGLGRIQSALSAERWPIALASSLCCFELVLTLLGL
jgi:hypothetical protein